MTLELKAKDGCCQEAAPTSLSIYVPCNAPAHYLVAYHGRTEGPYRMCEPCKEHNVRNRNGYVVSLYPPLVETLP